LERKWSLKEEKKKTIDNKYLDDYSWVSIYSTRYSEWITIYCLLVGLMLSGRIATNRKRLSGILLGKEILKFIHLLLTFFLLLTC